MVNGSSLRRLAAAPVAAPRVNPTRVLKRPVFSIDTGVSTGPAAAPKRTSAAREPQSQANATPPDARQLFGGYPANPALSLIATTPPFFPVFRTATINDGVQVWGLNYNYLAKSIICGYCTGNFDALLYTGLSLNTAATEKCTLPDGAPLGTSKVTTFAPIRSGA